MTTAIFTEDFLAICLILANGDINIRLEEIICLVEAYQESSDCHFGISRSDFRCAFNKLSFQIYHETGVGNYEDMLTRNPLLQHWIGPILKYGDVYFNDEGEHWCPHIGKVPSKVNMKMRDFFIGTNTHSPEIVMRFLNELGKNQTTLINCSRPGISS